MERQQSRSPIAQLQPNEGPYVPRDTISETIRTGCIGLGGGFVIAALQNALSKRSLGAMTTFTRGAPLMGLATAAPASYAFVSRSVMNLREKDDAWGPAIGGFVCGSILGLGLPSRRFPVVLGMGGVVALVQGTASLFGSRIDSFKSEDDTFEHKEIMRRTTRVPIEQTIAEIGEGRGIQPAGYEERRRERIKEKYGLEINPVRATVDGSV